MKEDNKNLKFLIAFHSFPKFGPIRLKKIKSYFPDLENAWKAKASELINAGLEKTIVNEFLATKQKINPEKIIEKLNKEKIKVLIIENNFYPQILKKIHNPPPLLYYRGTLTKNNEFSLAVVGTRKLTIYGRQATENIVYKLAKNNLTIVSGLAVGIDTIAHNTTLNAKGRTIAVLGTGLDKQSIYPSSNRYLSEKIISQNGLVISEFPLETPPLRFNFPQRNRLISGLSLGTLVIEAGKKSGALITAKNALEQNRKIFALPGNIYSPVSIGPNNLIKQGARAITTAEEILKELDLININSYINNKKISPETKEEKIIMPYLNHEPTHINEIARLTSLPVDVLNSSLILMEMKGMVKNLGNMNYVLAI